MILRIIRWLMDCADLYRDGRQRYTMDWPVREAEAARQKAEELRRLMCAASVCAGRNAAPGKPAQADTPPIGAERDAAKLCADPAPTESATRTAAERRSAAESEDDGQSPRRAQ